METFQVPVFGLVPVTRRILRDRRRKKPIAR